MFMENALGAPRGGGGRWRRWATWKALRPAVNNTNLESLGGNIKHFIYIKL